MAEKMARKLMAHFVDSTFGSETASWYRLGEDFEEYSVELNPDVETSKNILGNTTFTHNGYEISADGDPFYAREGDALFAKLQTIIDTQAQYTGLKTKALEAHLWEPGTTDGTYKAFTQDCYIVPTSYGGDTSGYQIPFTVYYVGDKTAGTYNLSTGTFAPTT